MLWGDVFAHREAFTIELALKKTSHSFGATLVKGILCNWLVCMAVWQANAAQDVAGKVRAARRRGGRGCMHVPLRLAVPHRCARA